jgi:hypothetical protein
MGKKEHVTTGKKHNSPERLLSKASSSSTTNPKKTETDLPISQTTVSSSVSSSAPKTPISSCRSHPTSSKASSASLTQRNLPKKKWFTSGSQVSTHFLTITSTGGTKHFTTCQNSKPKSTGNPSTCFMDMPAIKNAMFTRVFAMGCSARLSIVIFLLIKDGKTADALIKEDLRQKLIFKHYPEKYLRYIKAFTDKCLDNYLAEKYAEECSKTQMVNLEIDPSEINKKIENLETKCD